MNELCWITLQVPDGYEDLLHPRFVGRIGLEAGDVDWFGAMVKHMGEEEGLQYFRALAAANPQIRIDFMQEFQSGQKFQPNQCVAAKRQIML